MPLPGFDRWPEEGGVERVSPECLKKQQRTLWSSQVAPGNENALRLRVYGQKDGLE